MSVSTRVCVCVPFSVELHVCDDVLSECSEEQQLMEMHDE